MPPTVLWVVALALTPARLGLPTLPPTPVAAVIDVSDGADAALALGRGLEPGTTIALKDGAAVTLWLYPDTLWTVEGPGRFVVDPGRVFPIESAHVPVSVSAPPLKQAPIIDQVTSLPRAGRRLGPPAGPLHPAGEAVAADQRVLRWSAPPGRDASLALAVQQTEGTLRVLERWTGLRGGRLRTWAPLREGRWYRWEVTAGGDSAQAWFYVWTAEEKAALRHALAGPIPRLGPHPETAVAAVRAVALERAGAWSEAAARWRELLAARPGAPGVAARVRAIEGRVVAPPPRGLPALIARTLRR